MTTICLSMIVKNEAHVIRRCLDSVRPWIHSWVIVDTGSTDGTQQVIQEALGDLGGELHERPWRDFGSNRTEALELARGKSDYTLIIDADEELVSLPGFRMPNLVADAYQIKHVVGPGNCSFYLTQLVRSTLSWRYVGVLHEVIECPQAHSTAKLEGITTVGHFDSARNANPIEKYESDARVLEQALLEHPDNARYAFYLAQSYRDAGRLEQAIAAYERRAAMGGWDEEVWYSLFQIGVLQTRLRMPHATIVESHLRAYQARPQRAEPICELARYHRERKQYAIAHLFARAAADTQRPSDILFLDETVYAWRALDECAVSGYYIGKLRESLIANQKLLGEARVPPSERARLERNLELCRGALGNEAKRERNQLKRKRRRA